MRVKKREITRPSKEVVIHKKCKKKKKLKSKPNVDLVIENSQNEKSPKISKFYLTIPFLF